MRTVKMGKKIFPQVLVGVNMTELFELATHPEIVETWNIHELKWLFQLDVQIITLEKWVEITISIT